MTRPLEVRCPYCGARGGEMCSTPSGKTAYNFHSARTNPHLERDVKEVEVTPIVTSWKTAQLKDKLPDKGRFKVRCKGYVWCDYHGGVHEATRDHFEEGATKCAPYNWRRVYVESNDRKESFG